MAAAKGKPITRALIAKELATIVYAMLAKGEPFNEQFHMIGEPGSMSTVNI